MPFYRFHLDVPASPDVVVQRLQSVVSPKRWFWSSYLMPLLRDPSDRPFLGTVRRDSFKIYRNIWYRNSFLPIIRGRILGEPSGTRVYVTMVVSPWVATFAAGWFGAVGYASLKDSLVGGLGLLFLGVFMLTLGFYLEVRIARYRILEALA